MALEGHALLRHQSCIRERKDLKSPGIGQDRPRPGHKAVQIPQLRHDLLPGTQHQMICIAENALGSGFLNLLRGNAFDAPLRADRHERGSLE